MKLYIALITVIAWTKDILPEFFQCYIEKFPSLSFVFLIITLHVQRVASLLKVVVQEMDQRFFRQSEELRKVYFMIFNFKNLLMAILKFRMCDYINILVLDCSKRVLTSVVRRSFKKR